MNQVGSCPKCGAPIWSPSVWWGIAPPPTQYTCTCRFVRECAHCYCQEIAGSCGSAPHRVCCKCGDRVALPLGYSLTYRVTSTGIGDAWDGNLPLGRDVPPRC